jgi:hypothetical protein
LLEGKVASVREKNEPDNEDSLPGSDNTENYAAGKRPPPGIGIGDTMEIVKYVRRIATPLLDGSTRVLNYY